jgi:uncharacterized membrane protein
MIRAALRVLLAAFYLIAGVLHLVFPRPFIAITPRFVPAPEVVVWATGLAEIPGAIGLVQPFSRRLRQAAGWGLAAYALCVWPANVNHMLIDLARPSGGLGLAYHVPRLLAQPLLIALALWVGECWPPRRRSGA